MAAAVAAAASGSAFLHHHPASPPSAIPNASAMPADPSLAPLTPPPSRLPSVGTTIFTVMSALAAEKNAVNLGQGFPDFDCDSRIVDAVTQAMREGHNQYPPMAGVAPLRQAISE